MIVAIALAATSIRIVQESVAELVTRQLAKSWVERTGYQVTRVDADGNEMNLIINGSGDPSSLAELGP